MVQHSITRRVLSRVLRFVEETVARHWLPSMTKAELPHEIILSFDLFGVAGQELEIAVRQGQLECSGYRAVRRVAVRAHRQGNVRFHRSIRLPRDLDTSRVETERREGLLEVRIARRSAPTPLA